MFQQSEALHLQLESQIEKYQQTLHFGQKTKHRGIDVIPDTCVRFGWLCRAQNTGDLCGCCNMSESKHFQRNLKKPCDTIK